MPTAFSRLARSRTDTVQGRTVDDGEPSRCGAADFASCLRSCSVADAPHWSCREKVAGTDTVDGRDWLETFNADGSKLIETSEPATLMGHIDYSCSSGHVVVGGVPLPLVVASLF